jgi:hypothetical protein
MSAITYNDSEINGENGEYKKYENWKNEFWSLKFGMVIKEAKRYIPPKFHSDWWAIDGAN